MSRYVQINYGKFKQLMDTMTFTEVHIEGTFERVWKFEIPKTDFDIRVYSTIPIYDDVSRGSGTDAIRCMVFDRRENKILKIEKRVHRTLSALINTRLRCRDLYKHVRDNRCSCGGVMVKRTSKHNHSFMGCSNYPNCKNTKNIEESQLKLRLKIYGAE